MECTDEGYPLSGCSEVTEKQYNCLLAKEAPGSYRSDLSILSIDNSLDCWLLWIWVCNGCHSRRYLAAEDAGCTGLPPPEAVGPPVEVSRLASPHSAQAGTFGPARFLPPPPSLPARHPWSMVA